eukprot:4861199-Prymnesium_polylepis.1
MGGDRAQDRRADGRGELCIRGRHPRGDRWPQPGVLVLLCKGESPPALPPSLRGREGGAGLDLLSLARSCTGVGRLRGPRDHPRLPQPLGSRVTFSVPGSSSGAAWMRCKSVPSGRSRTSGPPLAAVYTCGAPLIRSPSHPSTIPLLSWAHQNGRPPVAVVEAFVMKHEFVLTEINTRQQVYNPRYTQCSH